MSLKDSSLYLTGLAHMASSYSKTMGPSYMEIGCYQTKNFKEEFSKDYSIPQNQIKIKETTESVETIIEAILGKELVEGFLYWLQMEAGEAKRVFIPEDDSSITSLLCWSEGGKTSFYFVEDVFFIECEKMTICMIIGNNE